MDKAPLRLDLHTVQYHYSPQGIRLFTQVVTLCHHPSNATAILHREQHEGILAEHNTCGIVGSVD